MTPHLPPPRPAFSEEVDELVQFTDPPAGRKPAFVEEVDVFVEFTEVATEPPTEAPGQPVN